MEEEIRDLKEESAAKAKKQMRRKYIKRFLVIYMIVIVLSIAIALVLRETGVINRYVYEEVENLGEREGVCFDNLLFSYVIVVNRGGQREKRWLCIMNNGDVYAFGWNDNESFRWDWYYRGDEKMNDNELNLKGYYEGNWEKMENVVYLGRFSDSAVSRLNCYVNNYDIHREYYYLNPPQDTVPDGSSSQQERKEHTYEKNEEAEWIAYGVYLYWYEQPERYWSKDDLIEGSVMKPTWWGGYKKEIRQRSLDENAIAAIELFESSGFYDRWVRMCLKGY